MLHAAASPVQHSTIGSVELNKKRFLETLRKKLLFFSHLKWLALVLPNGTVVRGYDYDISYVNVNVN